MYAGNEFIRVFDSYPKQSGCLLLALCSNDLIRAPEKHLGEDFLINDVKMH